MMEVGKKNPRASCKSSCMRTLTHMHAHNYTCPFLIGQKVFNYAALAIPPFPEFESLEIAAIEGLKSKTNPPKNPCYVGILACTKVPVYIF